METMVIGVPHDMEPMTGDVKHNKEGEPERVTRIELGQNDKQATGRYAVCDHVQYASELGA